MLRSRFLQRVMITETVHFTLNFSCLLPFRYRLKAFIICPQEFDLLLINNLLVTYVPSGYLRTKFVRSSGER